LFGHQTKVEKSSTINWFHTDDVGILMGIYMLLVVSSNSSTVEVYFYYSKIDLFVYSLSLTIDFGD